MGIDKEGDVACKILLQIRLAFLSKEILGVDVRKQFIYFLVFRSVLSKHRLVGCSEDASSNTIVFRRVERGNRASKSEVFPDEVFGIFICGRIQLLKEIQPFLYLIYDGFLIDSFAFAEIALPRIDENHGLKK